MKIQLLSDLHLESHPHFVPEPAPGADLLVLAGDIGSYQNGSLLLDPDFGLARFSPLQGWPTPVLYLPGNHEYDGLDFDLAHGRLRETCERLGMVWLEREVVQIAGVRFVGTTLWSDFDALAPATDDAGATLSHLLRARDKAFRAANYYLRKNTSLRNGEPMLAQALREQGLLCQQWLRTALAQPHAGPTVVVTHFAPSLQSADPRYGLTPGTAGFCNNLDELLAQADLWLHGHLHAPSDYVHRGCRVVANPLGYAGKDEQRAFMPRSVITLDAHRHATLSLDMHQVDLPPVH
ncbi:MAG: metallophosphoesterase [Betaproteobacteria bacterium]